MGVSVNIFFLFWPWNKIFENRRYLSTPPF